jgi:hypothetical protein
MCSLPCVTYRHSSPCQLCPDDDTGSVFLCNTGSPARPKITLNVKLTFIPVPRNVAFVVKLDGVANRVSTIHIIAKHLISVHASFHKHLRRKQNKKPEYDVEIKV